MDWRTQGQVGKVLRKQRPTLVKLVEAKDFPAPPAVIVSIRHIEQSENRELWAYILPFHELPYMVRAIGRHHAPVIKQAKSRLGTHLMNSREQSRWMLEQLLEPFHEIRDIGSAVITGCTQTVLTRDSLGKMTTPLSNGRELLYRASLYRRRALDHYQAGHVVQAQRLFDEGVEYIRWLVNNDPYDSALAGKLDEDGASAAWFKRMQRMHRELVLESINCSVVIGDTDTARHDLYHLCTQSEELYTSTPADIATINLYSGRSHVVDGALNATAYSFLRALHVSPGHEGTEKAVADSHDMVKNSLVPKNMIVKYSIEHVLKAFRYRTRTNTDLSRNRLREYAVISWGR